jgi:hypothetical protein
VVGAVLLEGAPGRAGTEAGLGWAEGCWVTKQWVYGPYM